MQRTAGRAGRAGVAALVAIVAACPVGAPDGDEDAGTADAGGPHAECLAAMPFDQELELLPGAAGTQIHAALDFDGVGIWLAFNLPNAAHDFDVWATRLGCDGAPLVVPFQVNTLQTSNQIDPSIVVADDQVLVAWVADNGQFPNNMDVIYRTFSIAGEPLMAAEAVLETTYNGTPVPLNVMFPTAVALGGGRFAIAASRGLEETGPFQVFVQELDADGALLGEAVNGFVEPTAGQIYPTLAADPAGGDLYLAWTSAEAEQPEQIEHTRLPAAGRTPDPSPPAVAASSGVDGSSSSYAVGPDGHVYLAYNRSNQITLRDGAVFSGDAAEVSFGAGGRSDHSPQVAAAAGGGAVFYYGNISGIQNQYLVQPFGYDGQELTLGQAQQITTDPVPPYAPAACHLFEDVYFAAWSAGQSPNFVIKGRFVRLQ